MPTIYPLSSSPRTSTSFSNKFCHVLKKLLLKNNHSIMLATRTIMLAYYVLGEFILKLKIMYAKLDIITRIPYV